MLTLSFLIATSCNNEDFFFELETDSFFEIAESQEYQSYLTALFNYNDAIVNPDTSRAEIIYKSDSLIVYSNSLEVQREQMEIVERSLFNKHPEYRELNSVKRSELFEYAIANVPVIHKIYGVKYKFFTRSSMSGPEAHKAVCAATWNDTQWTVKETSFPSVIVAAKNHAKNNSTEVGGYVFKDNSALWITDSNASSGFSDIGNGQAAKIFHFPVWDFPKDATPDYAFHTHPDENTEQLCGTQGNRKTMDGNDWNALATMKEKGCNKMLIIANDGGDYTWSLY